MVAWVLVFHLIGLVFWLGSILVVTQILAIHSEEPSTEARAAFGRLEMKLFKGLAHPGAALMVITGAILIGENPHYLREHWLHAKLLLVAILIVLDLRVYFRTTAQLAGRAVLQRRECMALHGAISLVLFGILILVLLKPFGAGGTQRLRSGLPSPPHRRAGVGLVGAALVAAHGPLPEGFGPQGGQPQGLPLRRGAEAGGTLDEDHS
jgi:putative membrane protein